MRRFNRNLSKKSRFFIGVIKANTIGLFSKRDFLIIAFFTLLGAGGVFAATLITISTPDSQGAGYLRATACDENVTIRALTASDTATGQLYVATIALSDISQNATTGCGNKTMQIALKINNQMRYATWDIQSESTDSTFYFTGVTSSISDYYAGTLLSPFQADGLTNVAIANIGSFVNTYTWSSVATSQNWISITSSSDGTKLAAVTYPGYIYTSTDSGVNWTVRSPVTASTTRYWYSITSSSDGTKLAAVVYGGYIYTSSDSGVNWTERSPVTATTTRNWSSITSSSDGTKLAAVTYPGYIYTSTDSGVNWTVRSPVTASTTRNWYSITSSSDGTKLAACVEGGYIYTSSDSGVNWTASSTDANRNWYSITSSSDGTKLAAGNNRGYIYKGVGSISRSSN